MKKVTITLSISQDTDTKISEIKKRYGISRSALIEKLAISFYEKTKGLTFSEFIAEIDQLNPKP